MLARPERRSNSSSGAAAKRSGSGAKPARWRDATTGPSRSRGSGSSEKRGRSGVLHEVVAALAASAGSCWANTTAVRVPYRPVHRLKVSRATRMSRPGSPAARNRRCKSPSSTPNCRRIHRAPSRDESLLTASSPPRSTSERASARCAEPGSRRRQRRLSDQDGAAAPASADQHSWPWCGCPGVDKQNEARPGGSREVAWAQVRPGRQWSLLARTTLPGGTRNAGWLARPSAALAASRCRSCVARNREHASPLALAFPVSGMARAARRLRPEEREGVDS